MLIFNVAREHELERVEVGAGDKTREWGIGCGPGFGEVDAAIVTVDSDGVVT